MARASCKECGTHLGAGDLFCPNCGAPNGSVLFACSECGHETHTKDLYCPECGRYDSLKEVEEKKGHIEKPKSIVSETSLFVCSVCGDESPTKELYCAECGSYDPFKELAKKKKRRKRLPKKAVLIPLGIVFALCIVYSQQIEDYYYVSSTTAPSDVRNLGNEAGLNYHGLALLLRSKPGLASYNDFHSRCPAQSQDEIELGCFDPKVNTITVLSIDREDISSEEVVVAAHEMLHAAYQKLTASERVGLNKLLEAQYATLNDSDLQDRMALYEKVEPGEKDNELHSILATEYSNLSPELESYYKKYFSNRTAVVSASNKFAGVLKDDEDKLTESEDRLTTEKSTIATQKGILADYNNQLGRYDRLSKVALAFGDYGGYVSYANAYNSLIPGQNEASSRYNTMIDQYNQEVSTYNGLLDSLQDIVRSLNGVPRQDPISK